MEGGKVKVDWKSRGGQFENFIFLTLGVNLFFWKRRFQDTFKEKIILKVNILYDRFF